MRRAPTNISFCCLASRINRITVKTRFFSTLLDVFTLTQHALIVSLAERYRLPAIYVSRRFAIDGGLMVYGPDTTDIFRRSASYVDRILKGAKPADLPIQQPMKFELIINFRAAKALGLSVPPSLLARADEVIE
jgi:putative ABC transport system substrate-binding protein